MTKITIFDKKYDLKKEKHSFSLYLDNIKINEDKTKKEVVNKIVDNNLTNFALLHYKGKVWLEKLKLVNNEYLNHSGGVVLSCLIVVIINKQEFDYLSKLIKNKVSKQHLINQLYKNPDINMLDVTSNIFKNFGINNSIFRKQK